MAEGNKTITHRKISQLQLSLYSTEELRELTVAKITKRGDNIKEKSKEKSIVYNLLEATENDGKSLVDLELGATDEADCKTCNQSIMRCPGHFGRIELFNPFITKIDGQIQILNAILNSFCDSCVEGKNPLGCDEKSKHSREYQKLIYDEVTLDKVKNLKNQTRLFALRNMKKTCPLHNVSYDVKKTDNFATRKQGKESKEISAKELEKFLKKMRNEDLEKIGVFNRPENMIIHIIPVLPNYLRLNYVDDDGTVHPQGTNAIYSKIIDTNNLIDVLSKMLTQKVQKKKEKTGKQPQKKRKEQCTLKNIADMSADDIENWIEIKTEELRELHHELILSNETKNNVKSIKMILDKKKGLFRNTALGKRGDYCARSTVSPDPSLNIYEVAIPKRIAKKLTTLEIVNKKNIRAIQSMLSVLQEDCDIKSIKRQGDVVRNTSEIPEDLLSNDNILVSSTAKSLEKDLNKLVSENLIIEVRRNDKVIKTPSSVDDFDDDDEITYKKKLKDRTEKDEIVGYEKSKSNILISSLNFDDYRKLKVSEKDVIHRYLRDGDVVTVGRNPSLHKHSLQALVVQIKEGYTIGMPIQLCAGYGMDFDGDEANIFVPQSFMTKQNVIANMLPQENIFSEQSHKVIVGVVQDALMGAYFMTSEQVYVPENTWNEVVNYTFKYFERSFPDTLNMDLASWVDNVKQRAKKLNRLSNSGRTLFSIVFPEDFYFLFSKPDNKVEIKDGILISGNISGEILYKANNSLIQTYIKRYGAYLGAELISNISRMCQTYLRMRGFTVGIKDCLKPKVEREIKDKIQSAMEMASKQSETVSLHPILEAKKEQEILGTLSERLRVETSTLIFNPKESYKIFPNEKVILNYLDEKKTFTNPDKTSQLEINKKTKKVTIFFGSTSEFSTIGLSSIEICGQGKSRIIKIEDQEDCFASMVNANAKGEKIQISQIAGLIGQATFSGQRIPYSMAGNTRVLPHFVANDKDPEARGFCTASYLSGVNSVQMYMNFIQAREPQTDVTTKTARTGYVQRKLISYLKDVVARRDGSSRTEKDKIVSYQYGVWGSSLDKIVDVDGESQFSNIVQRFREVKNMKSCDRAYVFSINTDWKQWKLVLTCGYQLKLQKIKYYRSWIQDIAEEEHSNWESKKYDFDKSLLEQNLVKYLENETNFIRDVKNKDFDYIKENYDIQLIVLNAIKLLPEFKSQILDLYQELKLKDDEAEIAKILSYRERDMIVYVPQNTPTSVMNKLNVFFDYVIYGNKDDEIHELEHKHIVCINDPRFVIYKVDNILFKQKSGIYAWTKLIVRKDDEVETIDAPWVEVIKNGERSKDDNSKKDLPYIPINEKDLDKDQYHRKWRNNSFVAIDIASKELAK